MITFNVIYVKCTNFRKKNYQKIINVYTLIWRDLDAVTLSSSTAVLYVIAKD